MNIEVAITLVKQAIDQDKKKNFEEAARCYREAIITFKTVAQFRGISKGRDLYTAIKPRHGDWLSF